jgi:hypothetical protein
VRHRVERERADRDIDAHSRRHPRRFDPGVSRADDDYLMM